MIPLCRMRSSTIVILWSPMHGNPAPWTEQKSMNDKICQLKQIHFCIKGSGNLLHKWKRLQQVQRHWKYYCNSWFRLNWLNQTREDNDFSSQFMNTNLTQSSVERWLDGVIYQTNVKLAKSVKQLMQMNTWCLHWNDVRRIRRLVCCTVGSGTAFQASIRNERLPNVLRTDLFSNK